MVSQQINELDEVLSYIIPQRYVIGRNADIIPIFETLTAIHQAYSSSLQKLADTFLTRPHAQSFVDEVTVTKKEEMEYLRKKATELAENLEEDDLIPMAPEVVHFLNTLLNYMQTASGKFSDTKDQPADLLLALNPSAFSTQHTTAATTFPAYGSRTSRETGADDLGYKMYILSQQLQRDWVKLVRAFEQLQFLRK